MDAFEEKSEENKGMRQICREIFGTDKIQLRAFGVVTAPGGTEEHPPGFGPGQL